MKSALVVTVDGFNARFLRAYGNSWVPTPNLDQLAAFSEVADFCIAEHVDPLLLFSAAISGIHSAAIDSLNPPASLEFQIANLNTVLVTDDHRIAKVSKEAFKEVVLLEPGDHGADDQGESGGSSQRLFAMAVETWQYQNATQPFLLWIHFKGMFGQWDAPLELQESFKDAEDPPPEQFLQSPSLKLDDDYDPDERVKIVHGYAAEVCQFDTAFGEFQAAIDLSGESTLTLFSGLRGFALGEHQLIGEGASSDCGTEIGDKEEFLYSEQLHVPLLIQTGKRLQLGSRSASLRQTSNLFWILKEWFDDEPESGDGWDESGSRNDRSVAVSLGTASIRLQSRSWSYTQPLSETWQLDQNRVVKLYVKPDDRLEINEVAGACPEVVSGMVAVLKNHLDSLRHQQCLSDEPVPDILQAGIE